MKLASLAVLSAILPCNGREIDSIYSSNHLRSEGGAEKKEMLDVLTNDIENLEKILDEMQSRNTDFGDVTFSKVFISSNGVHIWGLQDVVGIENKVIHYRNRSSGEQKVIGGSFVQMAASANGEHLWVLNRFFHIYYRKGEAGAWKVIPGGKLQISVSGNGKHVWAIGDSPREFKGHWGVWYTDGHNTNWPDRERDSRWHRDDAVALTQISVSGDGNHIWGVDKNGNAQKRTSADPPNNGAHGMNGQWDAYPISDVTLKSIFVSDEGDHVWGVDNNDRIHYRHGTKGDWMSFPDRALEQISFDGDEQLFWVVAKDKNEVDDGIIEYYSNHSWNQMNDINRASNQFSISEDGQHLCIVNSNLYCHNGGNGNFMYGK